MEQQKLLPIGTKVFDIRFGWGKITDNELDVDGYPYNVKFEIPQLCYSPDGKNYIFDINPTLSLTEYSLESGGFTPIKEVDFDAPKVGDIGYFWDNEEEDALVYAKLRKINTTNYKYFSYAAYKYFSKEVPQWFIDKMNNN